MRTVNPRKSANSVNKRRLNKLLANKLSVFGFFMFTFVIVLCLAAPLITDCDPTRMDMSLRYAPPSWDHIFGCDQGGRDIFARLLYGGRVSILIGLVGALAANLLGAAIGCVAGYFGGIVDQTIIYISEIFRCFPMNMLTLIIMGLSGQGVVIMIIVFAVTGWTGTMRQVRSRVLSLKQEVFVESCRATGIPSVSIMFRHILPNALGVFIINITTSVANYVLSEAGLSFLGMGVPKGTPTWGNMLNAARSLDVMQNHALLWVLPGVAIAIFVLGVNFFGDGLRDVFDVSED